MSVVTSNVTLVQLPDGRYSVRSPYNQEFVDWARLMQARWDGAAHVWIFPPLPPGTVGLGINQIYGSHTIVNEHPPYVPSANGGRSKWRGRGSSAVAAAVDAVVSAPVVEQIPCGQHHYDPSQYVLVSRSFNADEAMSVFVLNMTEKERNRLLFKLLGRQGEEG